MILKKVVLQTVELQLELLRSRFLAINLVIIEKSRSARCDFFYVIEYKNEKVVLFFWTKVYLFVKEFKNKQPNIEAERRPNDN